MSRDASVPNLSAHSSALVVSATGTGKTAIMAGIAKHWPVGRVMVLSHRFELNQQAMREFESVCSEPVDLEQGEYFADQRSSPHRIVVASVQTLNARRKGRYRMERFLPSEFGLLLTDEAHHATAMSYQRIYRHFRDGNPDIKHVGVTATPDRLDGLGMGSTFECVAADYNIVWAIENGWLVAPRQVFIRVDGMDLSEVKTTAGDLDQKQLSRLVEMEQALHQMAAPIVDICGERDQAIVFTASVAQAHRLAEMIRDYRVRKFGCCGQGAVAIDGSWSPQDPRRKEVVENFRNGSIQYLTNCSVCTEGFDAPNVRVVAIGRPTKSRALYQQMLGRGTRPLPGVVDGYATPAERRAAIAASDKPLCTVIDFVGQSGRHKLICTTDILGGGQPEEVIERAKAIQRSNGFRRSTLDAIREAQQAIDKEREAKRAKVTVGVRYTVVESAQVHDLANVPKVFCPGYMLKQGPSERQKNFMIKLGYTASQIASMNPKQANAAIAYAIANPKTWLARKIHEERKAEGRFE